MYSYKDVNSYIKNIDKHGFPYKRLIHSDSQVKEMMEKLKKKKWDNTIYEKYRLKNVRIYDFELAYKNIPLVLIHAKKDYYDFNNLSDMFQESIRLKCRLSFFKDSPEEFFFKNMKSIAEKSLKQYKEISPYSLREVVYQEIKECTSFKPLNLIYFIKKFKAKSVLDFSSGWGDRLLACIATNTRYIGVDPNKDLHPNYQKMIEFFGFKKATMLLGKIQDVKLPKEKVDLIFTSPPYFNMEIYTNKGKVMESNEKEWFDNFLKVAVDKTIKQLKYNGHLVININQANRNQNYINMMKKYISSLPEMHYEGVISYRNEGGSNHQPMWIWVKCKKIPNDLYNPKMVISKHEFEGKKFRVFRDDFLIGGTKQRSLVPLLENSNKKIFVYAGPPTGYAQLALAYSAFLTNKKAVVFLNGQTNLTRYARSLGAEIKICKLNLKDLQKRAEEFVKKTRNSKLMEFGLFENRKELQKAIIKIMPKVSPKRIWLVAGSATILSVLYKIFPKTKFMVVQVGKKIWPDQLELDRTTLFISKERFHDVAKEQPPYPTVKAYDAKLWTFFKIHGKSGDYIWNVGKEL